MVAKKETRCTIARAAQLVFGQPPGVQEDTRLRLLQAATEVFAELGYNAATTRKICRRAGVNLASIHYYYGDKAELYREVFRLPFLNDRNVFATLDISHVSLKEALHAFYQWFFPPIAEEDPMLQLFMRLHAREEAEASGVLGDAMLQAIRPNHDKMQALLCREFSLKKTDAEVDRLNFAVFGLATAYLHNRTALVYFSPHLIDGQKSRETMTERLVGYAEALINAERKRRSTSERVKK
jgi:AcrR family transcriptional regulator